MRRQRALATALLGALTLSVGGCAGGPLGSRPPLPPVQAPPPVPAYLQGDVIGGYAARAKKARAAKIAPLPVNEVTAYMTREELDLRRQTAGTGVDVIRLGDSLVLRLPVTLAFDVGSSSIRSQAVSSMTEIALTLKKYNRTLVDVLGHTDSTGTAAVNQSLSVRRADAVAAHLRSKGVAAARIATRGYGASQPIEDNGSERGMAANRRVEIRIVPLR